MKAKRSLKTKEILTDERVVTPREPSFSLPTTSPAVWILPAGPAGTTGPPAPEGRYVYAQDGSMWWLPPPQQQPTFFFWHPDQPKHPKRQVLFLQRSPSWNVGPTTLEWPLRTTVNGGYDTARKRWVTIAGHGDCDGGVATASPPTKEAPSNKSRSICRHFLNGKCTYNPCNFSHDLPTGTKAPRQHRQKIHSNNNNGSNHNSEEQITAERSAIASDMQINWRDKAQRSRRVAGKRSQQQRTIL